ncbi:hypothetical protein SteCoe_12371 [Stentor coeruleus]|uniref:Uncharacterized protein n=1 Tax=Stentor coeruleus TaxID=5963 RepID=A0A1R2CAY7_9CILI|nr:hypothetical protein SteCoe_12371 [Stentor coeruleus]
MLCIFRRAFTRFCQGCGVMFQHVDANQEGFIPENKYKNTLTQNFKVKNILEEIKQTEDIKLKDFKPKRPKKIQNDVKFEEIDEIDEIEERVKTAVPLREYQQRPKIKPIICMRCFKISKYGTLPEVSCAIDTKTPINSLKEIFEPIKHYSIIIKVVDIIDFNGSFIKEVYDLASDKKCHLILVLNKFDALPVGAKETRIFQWAVNSTRGLISEQNICAVSSRTGFGFDKVIKLLRQLTEKIDRKIYVIGATNSGKSSFINKLSEQCWNLPMEKYKKPSFELTTSSFPGTTLSPIEVPLKSLGVRIIDTPGIPTFSQVTFKIPPEDAKMLIPNKKINPIVLTATEEFSFWIGAMARIELIEGDFKYLTFFVSQNTSVHKTKRELGLDVYDRQAGKLLWPKYDGEVEWIKHEAEVYCVANKRAARDIVIHGLGWVSVTGLGRAKFDIYLAKGVGFNMRDPLMPYEASPDKVAYNKGRTFNSNPNRK